MIKILIIEDDETVRTNMHELLFESGYEVLSAQNGSEGIKKAKEFFPDIIICDIMMPEKDGYEVIHELGKDASTASIPFIFLSARAEVSDIRQGLQSGADDYLLKPYTSAELLKAIELRLSKRTMIAQSERTKLGIENSASEVKKDSEITTEIKVLDYHSHVFVISGDRPEVIKVSRIRYILAESEYSRVFTADGRKPLVRRLLKEWEEMLPQGQFLRIHRSTLINIEHIQKIEKWFNHSFRVHIEGAPEPFIVSRRFSAMLRKQISIG